MNIIKTGYFDNRGMPMDWWIDADKSERPKSAVMTLGKDGEVFVDGVEVREWSDTKRQQRVKTLGDDKKLGEFYKEKKK